MSEVQLRYFLIAVMAEDEYESLPESTTFRTHLMAGAAAGILEHAVMYPVDSVKVRLVNWDRVRAM